MKCLRGGSHDGVRVAAETGERDHAIAFRESDHGAADRVDLSSDLVAHHHRWF